MTAAPQSPLVEKVALAIRNADNGLDGDPIGVLLDEAPLIDLTTTTRNEADVKILVVCRSAAQAALDACHADEMLEVLRDALDGFKCTQRVGHYSKDHWAQRAQSLLAKLDAASSPPSGLGYCPTCGAPGRRREKRPFGNDICEEGHSYPSSNALPTKLDGGT